MELQFVVNLLQTMELSLHHYDIGGPGELEGINYRLDIVADYVRQLRTWAREQVFDDQQTEITYFKALQPVFEGWLIFLSKVQQLELYLPPRSDQDKAHYYRAAYATIQQYHHHQNDYYAYFRQNASHLDLHYFTRPAQGTVPPTYETHLYLLSDPYLRTPKSFEQATMLAYQQLATHLDDRLWLLEKKTHARQAGRPLQWQASKAALCELVYALLEIRAFGGHITDIKKVADFFQEVFGIQIANIYATYEDMRLRKKDRTPFLNNLINALLRRMDHDDEYVPRK